APRLRLLQGIVHARDLLVSVSLRPPWSGVSPSPRNTGPSQGRLSERGRPTRVLPAASGLPAGEPPPVNARAPACRARGVKIGRASCREGVWIGQVGG